MSDDANSSISIKHLPDNTSTFTDIREDHSRPGLMLGLMSTFVVQFSVLEQNATVEPLLDIREHLPPHLSYKSNPSSFYQSTTNGILIVDNGLNCIHLINTVDLTIGTHSGTCTTNVSSVTDYGIDGSFNKATYNSPTYITSYGGNASSLLLLDLGSIR